MHIFWNRIVWNKSFMKIPQKCYHLRWIKNKLQRIEWNEICGMQWTVVEKHSATKSLVNVRNEKNEKKNKILILIRVFI